MRTIGDRHCDPDISAVVVNLTAINATDSGELVAYAWGDVVPGGTSLVYGSGGVMSNAAIVPVDANGRIALFNSAPLDVVVDVVGYYTNADDFDTWSYAYSPDGIRSTKSGPGTNTTYKWDRASGLSMLLSETTANVGTTYYIYGPAGLPIEQINANGSVYFIHHDQLGSTRLITNAAGNAVATISYDAYGNERARSSNASSPFGFAGQYSDAESGYQYLRARYYDPSTGQFLTRDPIEALTRSAYGYVYGNPLNATDPSGLCGFLGDGPCTPSGIKNDIGQLTDEATPDCFTWQKECESIISRATDGEVCSRFTDAGCTEPIAEARAQVCPTFGCVAVTWDGHHFHHHEGLGPSYGVSLGLSTLSSCDPHESFWGSWWLFSGGIDHGAGGWSPSGGIGLGWPLFGFGVVHWLN